MLVTLCMTLLWQNEPFPKSMPVVPDHGERIAHRAHTQSFKASAGLEVVAFGRATGDAERPVRPTVGGEARVDPAGEDL